MKIIKFVAKNWLSFEEVNYGFLDKPIQIKGKNLTDDGQDSNGAGKSAIIEGLSKLIINETSRKEVDKKLIRFGCKEAYLSTSIHCPLRKETLLIEKIVKARGSGVQITVGDEVKYSFTDNMTKEANLFILNWLGMQKADIQNFYIINREKFKSFFSSSNTDKLSLINRFSNANIVDGVDGDIKEDIKELSLQVTTKTSHLNQVEGKLQAIEELIEQEQSIDFEKRKADKIEAYKRELEEIRAEVSEVKYKEYEEKEKLTHLKSLLPHYNSRANKLTKSLENFDLKSFDDDLVKVNEKRSKLDLKLAQMKESKVSLGKNLDIATDMLQEIDRNIKGAVECPSCKFEFSVGDPDVDIGEEKVQKVEVGRLLDTLKGQIDKVQQNICNFSDTQYQAVDNEENNIYRQKRIIRQKFNKLSSIINNYTHLVGEVNYQCDKIEKGRKRFTADLSLLMEEGRMIEAGIAELKKAKGSEKLAELKIKQSTLKKQKTEIEAEIVELEEKIYSKNKWIKNFKSFKSHVANKSLSVIQTYCNKYLGKMDSDLRIKMEGFKLKNDDTLKEEITPYIIRDGESRLFGGFSGGEKVRLEFAMILALQEMINSTNKWGGLQFLFCDEITEALDGLGLSELMKSLSSFTFPILITTHITNKTPIQDILAIVKENSISRIETNKLKLEELF